MSEVSEPLDGDDAPDYLLLEHNDVAMRAFILKHYGSGGHEIAGNILVENMEHVFQWVRGGKVPSARTHRRLKAVETTEPK